VWILYALYNAAETGMLVMALCRVRARKVSKVDIRLAPWMRRELIRETLNKSFGKLRTNGNFLIPFVVSLSNHVRSTLNQSFLGIAFGLPMA